MPHAALSLQPGVDLIKTPALNEAAISSSNLIRYLADRPGVAFPQRLGGWIKYCSTALPSIVRALKAWEDLNGNTWLGIGCTNGLYGLISSQSSPTNISPRTNTTNHLCNIVGTSSSYTFTINDSGSNTNIYSSLYFATPISVGGTLVSGVYSINTTTNSNQYTILNSTYSLYNTVQTCTITNASPTVITVASAPVTGTRVVFSVSGGGSLPTGITAGTTYFVQNLSTTTFNISATPTGSLINTSSAGLGTFTASFPGQTPYFSVTGANPVVSCLFPNHGLSAGSTFSVTVPTTVGGLTLSGNYTVLSTGLDANNFQFVASNYPASTAEGFENSDNMNIVYYYAVPPSLAPTAFGANAFGSNAFGGAPSATAPGSNLSASNWFLDNWGQYLVACPTGGGIFVYIPNYYIGNATLIANSPVVNNGIFVAMPQQQLVAWGSSFNNISDPLLLRWSDVGNYNVWIAQSINQAGSFRIPTGSRIVSCMQGPQQGLIWTDLDLWAMQYVGAPLVYGFNKIGSNCGLIAPKAATQLSNITYWMSQKQFFMLSGNGVQPIACPIWDVVFQNLNTNYVDNIRAGANTSFNEIWWFYPSVASTNGENDSYVKYNTVLQSWDFGSLARTAWIDQSVLGQPIASGTDNFLYQHEMGNSAAGMPMNSYFTTGYFSMSEGDQQVFVDQIWPDMKWNTYSNSAQNAVVYLTINSVNYPGDTPISYGPYPITQQTEYLSVRVRGRLFSFTIGSTDVNGTVIGGEQFWRLGKIRYRLAPDGKY
jgi:hypothetical protein